MLRLAGTITLKRALVVAEGALGRSFDGRLDMGSFLLTLPARVGEDLVVALVESGPFIELSRDSASWLNSNGGWTEKGSDSTYVINVRIEAEITDTPDRLVGLTFGSEFNYWYETMTQWLEVWTNRLLDRVDTTLPAVGRVRFERPDGSRGSDEWLQGMTFVDGQRIDWNETPATAEQVGAACQLASRGIAVPTEWLALTNARRHQDRRLAVIEASTAAEIALSKAIDEHLSVLPGSGAQYNSRRISGIAGAADLLRHLTGENWVSQVKAISEPRNAAAPAAKSPRKLKPTARSRLHTRSF